MKWKSSFIILWNIFKNYIQDKSDTDIILDNFYGCFV